MYSHIEYRDREPNLKIVVVVVVMFSHSHSSNNESLVMEITVISARGLKSPSSVFSRRRLRPFVTVTSPAAAGKCHVYATGVDEEGGVNPAWGDRFRVPLDPAFFTRRSSVCLRLFTRRLVAGERQLGWCLIPAADVGLPPSGVRYLSYRLRDGRDGTGTHGVVNLAVKLEGSFSGDACRTVIGVPVTAIPRGGATCHDQRLRLG